MVRNQLLALDRLFSLALLPMAIYMKRRKKLEILFSVFMNIVFVATGYCIFKNFYYLHTRTFVMENIVYVLALIFVVNVFWISRYQRDSLVRIYSFINDLRQRNDDYRILQDRYLKSYLLKVGSVLGVTLTLMSVLPILVALSDKEKLGTTPTLLFPSWFPWNIDTVFEYSLTIFLQLIFGGLLYSLKIGSVVLVLCCAVCIKTHIAYFTEMVRRLDFEINRIRNQRSKVLCGDCVIGSMERKLENSRRDSTDRIIFEKYSFIISQHRFILT